MQLKATGFNCSLELIGNDLVAGRPKSELGIGSHLKQFFSSKNLPLETRKYSISDVKIENLKDEKGVPMTYCCFDTYSFLLITPPDPGTKHKAELFQMAFINKKNLSKAEDLEVARNIVKYIQNGGEVSSPRKGAIPSAVKREVWRRDEGHCVECGSKENLEYDHIIPVSKGGANTVRNLQLLCEHCNRSKGANIQ